MAEIDEAVRLLAAPLFVHQKADRVWFARCCGRMLVTVLQAPDLCSVCKGAPAQVGELLPSDIATRP